MINYPAAAALASQAAERIEKGWTQGAAARTKDNVPVNEQSAVAVKFCLLGAIHASGPLEDAIEVENDLTKELAVPYQFGLIEWNDHPGRQKKEVVQLLRSAEQRFKAATQE